MKAIEKVDIDNIKVIVGRKKSEILVDKGISILFNIETVDR